MSEPPVFIKGDQGAAGERGAHGDHGQDGRQGPQGEPGLPGSTGRRGPNLKGTDRRLLFLLGFFTLGMVLVFGVLSHQQHEDKKQQQQYQQQEQQFREQSRRFQNQIAGNCVLINRTNAKINAILAQSARNVRNTTGLSPAQKAQAIKNAESLHLPITECPPKQ